MPRGCTSTSTCNHIASIGILAKPPNEAVEPTCQEDVPSSRPSQRRAGAPWADARFQCYYELVTSIARQDSAAATRMMFVTAFKTKTSKVTPVVSRTGSAMCRLHSDNVRPAAMCIAPPSSSARDFQVRDLPFRYSALLLLQEAMIQQLPKED